MSFIGFSSDSVSLFHCSLNVSNSVQVLMQISYFSVAYTRGDCHSVPRKTLKIINFKTFLIFFCKYSVQVVDHAVCIGNLGNARPHKMLLNILHAPSESMTEWTL